MNTIALKVVQNDDQVFRLHLIFAKRSCGDWVQEKQ